MDPIWSWSGIANSTTVGATGLAERAKPTASDPFSQLLGSANDALDSLASAEEEEVGSGAPAVDSPAGPFPDLLAENPFQKEMQVISIEELRQYTVELRASLQQRIRDTLSEAGIDTETSVQISISPYDGRLEVAGDHPQQALIEATLNQAPGLASDFRELAGYSRLIAAADTSLQFSAEYAANPQQAIAKYPELFNNQQEHIFSLLLDRDSASWEIS